MSTLTDGNLKVYLRGEQEDIRMAGVRLQPILTTILRATRLDCAVTVLVGRKTRSSTQDNAGIRIKRAGASGVECTWRPETGADYFPVVVQTPTAFVRNAEMLHNRMSTAFEELVKPKQDNGAPNPAISGNGAGEVRPTNVPPAQGDNQQGNPDMNATERAATTTSSEEVPLGERVKQFREMNDLTAKQFADRCNVSYATISRLERGEPVRDSSRRNIEAVLAGQTVEAEAEELPTFDATSEQLIAMIGEQAGGKDLLDELLRLIFNRWKSGRSVAEAQDFVVDVLRKHLVSQPETERLDVLLELRDYVKKTSSSS